MSVEARKGKNEALFRRINEGIEEVVTYSHTLRSAPIVFVCECSQLDCAQALELTLEEYRAIRGEARHFVVVPGHVSRDVERVIRESSGYVVVEKNGSAATIAEATDPNP